MCERERERGRERERCIVRSFCRYTNSELVVKYARWALERDEELATKIFTEREDNSEVLSPHRVLDYLKSFPIATVSYLEYIIRNKGLKVSSSQLFSVCNIEKLRVRLLYICRACSPHIVL